MAPDEDESIIPGRDTRISDIFYHFQALTSLSSGRTVGRKIGVVQEIVLHKYLDQSEVLRRRLLLEQRLVGKSGAGHKVEFSWYGLRSFDVAVGAEIPETFGLSVKAAIPSTQTARIEVPGAAVSSLASGKTVKSGALRAHLNEYDIEVRIHAISGHMVTVDVLDRTNLLASLESKRVGAQRFSGSNHLGSGIQTIEKAKQASLVAIDIDLAYNGNVKPLEDSSQQKQTLSLVALGNGVHWTNKDKAILSTFVDFTFLVKDTSIIRYADFVKALSDEKGEDFIDYFMAYFNGMTIQEPDAFAVHHNDFSIIVPAGEKRTLLKVLEDHMKAVDNA